jgi:hypothetical protein
VPTTPQPVPTEYIPPIPYTGVGYDNQIPDYIKNIAIGAGLGAAAGIAGVALHKRHEDDDEEKE